MKKIYILIIIFFSLAARGDYWTQKADFPSVGRELPFSFGIGTKGYAGGGAGHNDLWEYNPAVNTWTQKASITGNRRAAVSFSINNKGYVGLGMDGSISQQDFWEYDPSTNVWTQKANFGGGARSFAASFVIGNKGYVAGGFDASAPYNDDFWEWDSGTNTWTQLSNLPVARRQAVGFSINGKGYVSTGENSSGVSLNDLLEYDPALNNWIPKASLPGLVRVDATGFTICEKGYLGTGGETPLLNDFWQFDPGLNQWIQKANFGGQIRDDATSFVIGTKGYLGLGQGPANLLFDFWEYTPDSACATGIEEITNTNFQFTISPNPASEFILISREFAANEKIKITITDINGKTVETQYFASLHQQTKINISNLPNGIYFVTAESGNQKTMKRFIKN